MEIISVFLASVSAVAAVTLVILSLVYLKTRNKTNPHSLTDDDRNKTLHEKFPHLKTNPNSNSPTLEEVWIQQIREGTVEYKTFQGRGKPPIEIGGFAFEYIRDKTQSNEFTIDKPILEYDEEKDPDKIPKKNETTEKK